MLEQIQAAQTLQVKKLKVTNVSRKHRPTSSPRREEEGAVCSYTCTHTAALKRALALPPTVCSSQSQDRHLQTEQRHQHLEKAKQMEVESFQIFWDPQAGNSSHVWRSFEAASLEPQAGCTFSQTAETTKRYRSFESGVARPEVWPFKMPPRAHVGTFEHYRCVTLVRFIGLTA